MSGSNSGHLERRIDELEHQAQADQETIRRLQEQAEVDRALIAHLEGEGVLDRDKIANLEIALVTARRIGAAMGVLMGSRRITDAQAFELLRTVSQAAHRKLRDVADEVVFTGALPAPELDLSRRPAPPPPASDRSATGRGGGGN